MKCSQPAETQRSGDESSGNWGLGRDVHSQRNVLKVPHYTVFHQFHTAVRGPTTLYLKCIAPNPSVVQKSLYWEQAVSVPAPLNANELRLSTPALSATRSSQGEDAIYASRSMR